MITQWKPGLALTTDHTLLNLSVPETIPTIQSIWRTVLPWFHSKMISIGADEYDSSFVCDYNHFVGQMNDFIGNESGKSVRIWGTYPPRSDYTNIPTNVSIQHWAFFEDNPYFDYIDNGYNVVNSDDAFYVVNKYSGSYPQTLKKTRIFNGNPAGGAYAPNIFDMKNATNNPSRDNPFILGHIAALWNDYGPNATVHSEAYFAWRDNLPAPADKQWGGNLTEVEYDSVFDTIQASVPAQNLDMSIASKTSTIVEYDFAKAGGSKVPDSSGNGYNAFNHGCVRNGSAMIFDGNSYIATPLTRKGRSYVLSFSVYPTSSHPGSLFRDSDSALMSGNGTTRDVTFIGDGNAFSLNHTLPANEWTDVVLAGLGDRTFLQVDRGPMMEFTTKIGVAGSGYVWERMALPAPLARIGQGFDGMMRNITLKSIRA